MQSSDEDSKVDTWCWAVCSHCSVDTSNYHTVSQYVLWPDCIREFGDISVAPEMQSSFISAYLYVKHSKAVHAFLVDLTKM